MKGPGLLGCASGCWRSAARVKLDALRPAFAHTPTCAKPGCRARSAVRAQAQGASEPEHEHPRGIFETYPQSAETVTILDARRVPCAERQAASVQVIRCLLICRPYSSSWEDSCALAFPSLTLLCLSVRLFSPAHGLHHRERRGAWGQGWQDVSKSMHGQQCCLAAAAGGGTSCASRCRGGPASAS